METMTERILKVGKMFRDFTVQRADINTDKRTVALSFSSETDQVARWFGVEILDHSPGAVDLTRLKRSGALLLDHDPRNQVGVIEEVTVGADRKGRAVVRFGRSARAQEIFQDVVDGIRTNVSCGYDPMEMKLE
ncbi:MAG TPA: phage major capsid protein, partial [Nitrospirota bacterium]|nr:phage major capsid protein [Nitrospirota bacterium]